MGYLLNVAMLPAMRLWAAAQKRSVSQLPRPMDAPQVHSPGSDSDRVLLFGAGPAIGYGVSSHDLALPGSLARALTARTGRGADVDVMSDPSDSIRGARARLQDVKLWRYDAIVVSLGVLDSFNATSEAVWRRDVTDLLEFLTRESSRSTRIFLLGVQSIRSIPMYNSPFGAFAERQAHALNALTEEICRGIPRTEFVRVTTGYAERTRGQGGSIYRLWADELAGAMVSTLDAERGEHEPGEPSEPDGPVAADAGAAELERQRAVDSLGIVGTEPEKSFDRFVAMARQLYGVESALFSLITSEFEWAKAASGTDMTRVPREDSLCALTIEHRGLLLIPDASVDPRSHANPFVTGSPHIRFYAGFPVESPSGEKVGALCIFDPRARHTDSSEEQFDGTMLRELALLVQAELRAGPRE